MQDELDQLRGENERLRIIISALADKIRSIENLLNSNVPESIGVKKSNDDIPAGSVGVNYPNDNIPVESIGVNLLNTSYDFQSVGVKNEKDNIALKNIGVNSLEEPVSDKRIGEKRLTWILAVNGLRKEMRTSSISGVENAAKILVQLHEHSRNSYKDLRKLTGLSEDGLTKRIMALKKKGLIVRTAFQQYTLTGKAMKILEEAVK